MTTAQTITLGKALIAKQQRDAITAAEAARRIGITQPQYADYASDYRLPSKPQIMEKIRVYLEADEATMYALWVATRTLLKPGVDQRKRPAA